MSVHKVALVTGASRGIGRAIAEQLARDGILVAVHFGRSAAAANEVVAGIIQHGGKAFPVQADLGSIEQIEQMFTALDQALLEHTGEAKLDILINNAGVTPVISIAQMTESEFDELFDINVKAPFFVTKQALQRLRDGGRIVNVSSMSAIRARGGIPAYSATKGAINSMSLSLAQLLGSRGITVNAVAPGATETDLISDLLTGSNSVRMQLQSKVVLGRLGQPKDIADVVSFLVSEQGGWLSGQVLQASGGQEL